jgi:putative toxin-antitoxin system antitoxin component (TIGR02293 family)
MRSLSVEEILGGKKIFRGAFEEPFELMKVIEKGIPKQSLESFLEISSFTMEEISKILHVSTRTLQRNQVLNSILTDQLFQVAKVFQKGFSVFESKEEFLQWLELENKALGDKKPMSLLENSVGRELITDLLGRIEYGVYS